MKLRTLTAALVMAGVSANASALDVTGDVPNLTMAEKGGFILIEALLSSVAQVITFQRCEVTAGTYDMYVSTNFQGYGEGFVDGKELKIENITPIPTKGELFETADGDNPPNTKDINGVRMRRHDGLFGIDLFGSMLYGNSTVEIDNGFDWELWDEHIIKDFWKRKDQSDWHQVDDNGLELITKLQAPVAKYWQTSEYTRPNGGPGSISITKSQIAPNSANLCTMTFTAAVGDFAQSFFTQGGEVTVSEQ